MRRLVVLVRGLPADAATVRAVYPETAWSTTDYLLASLLDNLRMSNWMTVELNRKKSARNPLPSPVPRPGDAPQSAPEFVSGKQLADWIGKVG